MVHYSGSEIVLLVLYVGLYDRYFGRCGAEAAAESFQALDFALDIF